MKIFAPIGAFFLTAAVAVTVQAAEFPFSQHAFDQAIKEQKPVIVDFAASWCPTCRAQKPIVQSLMGEPKMKNVTLFVADYDKEQALKRSLKVVQQSTFVVFKNGKEVARSTGQTQREELEALFSKAL
jgi:thiol-disulfide isomerase/thioredoxin